MEYLQRFHFKWSYRPGRLNVADPVSRRPYPESAADHSPALMGVITRAPRSATTQVVEAPGDQGPVPIDQATAVSFQAGYQVDTEVQSLLDTGVLTAAHGLLWHKDSLVVPAHGSLRRDVMYNCHDASVSGHVGIRKTKELIRRQFWWPKMDSEIETYVQTCATCQRDKARTAAAHVPLQPLEVPGRPWQSVSMDFITGLPKTKTGKTAILVFVDRLTKMMHMCATVNECTSADCAFLFLIRV